MADDDDCHSLALTLRKGNYPILQALSPEPARLRGWFVAASVAAGAVRGGRGPAAPGRRKIGQNTLIALVFLPPIRFQ
jgi:hypothetical protein